MGYHARGVRTASKFRNVSSFTRVYAKNPFRMARATSVSTNEPHTPVHAYTTARCCAVRIEIKNPEHAQARRLYFCANNFATYLVYTRTQNDRRNHSESIHAFAYRDRGTRLSAWIKRLNPDEKKNVKIEPLFRPNIYRTYVDFTLKEQAGMTIYEYGRPLRKGVEPGRAGRESTRPKPRPTSSVPSRRETPPDRATSERNGDDPPFDASETEVRERPISHIDSIMSAVGTSAAETRSIEPRHGYDGPETNRARVPLPPHVAHRPSTDLLETLMNARPIPEGSGSTRFQETKRDLTSIEREHLTRSAHGIDLSTLPEPIPVRTEPCPRETRPDDL
eukprot:scaffold769_cov278-Pavlova_lutheri.AAC.1